MATEVLSDAPESADRYEFSVKHGDVILLATDGIFDNIPDSVLVKEVGSLQRGPDAPDAAEIQVIKDLNRIITIITHRVRCSQASDFVKDNCEK